MFRHSIKIALDRKLLAMEGERFKVFFTEISTIKQTKYLIVMLGKFWPTLSVWTVKDGVSIKDSVRFLVCLSSVILIGHEHPPPSLFLSSLSLLSLFSLCEKNGWIGSHASMPPKFGWAHNFKWVGGPRFLFFTLLLLT